jgi:zinc transport system substrate-binding protein
MRTITIKKGAFIMKMKFINILGIIVICSLMLTGCYNSGTQKVDDKNADGLNIVTSFYPIYIETLNVAKDISNVKVTNLTKPQTGCLHDYSLTPVDIETLERADIFVINGAGMEAFMDKVIKQQPDLKIVEASKGIDLMNNNEEVNAHVWMSITDCITQVKNIEKQLSEYDKANAAKYKSNAEDYIKRLKEQQKKMHNILDNLKNKDIVTFHEAFPYFAKEFNLNIAAVIEREPGSEPTPKELAETINTIKQSNIKALFAEPQYSAKAADIIAQETGAKVYSLDPIVTGDGSLNSYIDTMNQNLKSLEQALK